MLNSIRTKIMIFFSLLFIIFTLIIAVIFGFKASIELSASYKKNAINLLESINYHITTQHKSILFHEENTLKQRQIELNTNVNLIFAVVQSYYDEYKIGTLTLDEAKKRSIERVKITRYLDDVGYFWINDTGKPFPKMVMHPTLPELDGTVLDDPVFNYALGVNENLFKAFVDITEKYDEGYVDYLWPKPTPTGLTEIQPKISYVKIFKPWNWIIGTGLYIDDIKKEAGFRLETVIKELNDTISNLKVGEHGYFFIFNEDGDVLLHPNLRGTNFNHLKNPETGLPLVQELKDASKSETNYLTYLWDKPGNEGQFIFRKTSYVSYYEPLGWYIASTVYQDDLLKPIYSLIMFISIVVIISIIIIIYLSIIISRGITKPLFRLIKSISLTNESGIPLNPVPKMKTVEFNNLRNTINTMISSIIVSHNKLKSIFDYSFKTMIMATDVNGIITVFNSGAERILGYKSSEMIEKQSLLEIHLTEEINKRAEELSLEYNKKIEGFDIFTLKTMENGYEEREWTYVKKNGEHILINLIITALRDNNNDINGYLGFAYDISDLKRQKNEIISKNRELFILNSELKEHKYHLEKLVKERTNKLELSLNRLKDTQTQLIESEKMASLGGLVAGVAHEINTPVGIGVTSASYLELETERFLSLYENERISKTELKHFLTLCSESSRLILSSMIRASDLIKSFKQVAVDQASEEKRPFQIKTYMHEILVSIHSLYKHTNHKINIHSEEDYLVNSYPGALYQVITNLIRNSLIHGFDSIQSGIIDIHITKDSKNINIKYRDTGKGIPIENMNKIYEPFFTTNRANGGCGLGMNIVFNLIDRNLEGSIDCKSTIGEFTEFNITFPHNIE